MEDWPAPPAHIVLMLYTLVAILTLCIVSSKFPFQCA